MTPSRFPFFSKVLLVAVLTAMHVLGVQAQPSSYKAPGTPSALATPSSSSPRPAAPQQAIGSQPDAAEIRTQPPTLFDYSANLNSEVFGAQLFTGAFARQGATQFNPDYAVAVGDKVQVRMWGAFEFDQTLVVDPKGNIFIPHAGPVQLLGVRNQDMQRMVEAAVARTFRNNVNSYASLAAAQPVRVFVGGFVSRPGLYSGTSMDSLLHYLDQAGGIDPNRGSFLGVEVKRGTNVRSTANLYDFLLKGTMPLIQLSDGDVIFVPQRQHTVKVTGLVANAKRFEFSESFLTVADLVRIVKPQATATHVRVIRNSGNVRNTEYFPLAEASLVNLQNGDELEFTADKKPGNITVRVEGEHQSPQEYVLPYGARVGELLQRIVLNDRSQAESVQLFRLSVRQRQKDLLAISLRSLEAALLTARSGSSDEARLRTDEANLTLQWVDRAKQIEPLGQVVIADSASRNTIMLENGDVIRIPTRDALVLISGEVLFPNAVAHQAQLGLGDYIQRAGGFTQNADNNRVVVARLNGSFEQTEGSLRTTNVNVRPGDQILVLPKVDEKNRQFWKDMTQIIYQIAVSSKVILGL
jgi:protein involved in polysaccharide export with SLBB domain